MRTFIFIGLILVLSGSCAMFQSSPGAATKTGSPTEMVATTAPVVVYKTKKDYSKNVPVTLSADNSRIIAYPAPGDLKHRNGAYTYPTKLKKGYFLDNRGVGPNTAFLSLSYAEYAALAEIPDLKELKSWIVDADPILEIYTCPKFRRTNALEATLNQAIKNGELASLCTSEDSQ